MFRVLSFLALLGAVVVALWLYSQQAQRNVSKVRTLALEPAGHATPQTLHWREAQRLYDRLAELVASPVVSGQELAAMEQQAANWAAGSLPGSPEYRLAVALRAAAWALAQGAPQPSPTHRQKAQRELSIARNVLAGESPGSVTYPVSDQLKNLQIQHSQEVGKALEEP
ncbi:MAG: hypothetical protein NZ869_09945 [Thermoanaerobaculum sp.]|nr:hypothetical protein [Thermoanaerobaculum sp.]